MSIFFTSDQHFGHKAVISHANRPYGSAREMDDEMIANWNRVVTAKDTVYHLGDMGVCSPKHLAGILKKLRGTIHLVSGNHDHKAALKPVCRDRFASTTIRLDLYVSDSQAPKGKRHIVLDHYAARTWNKRHWGSWHLYGHCVDTATEILTAIGWRNHSTIRQGDPVLSYNHTTGQLEVDAVREVLQFPDYSGQVYTLSAKSTDMRLTSLHTCVRFSRDGRLMYKEPAHQFFDRGRATVRRCGILEKPGIPLSDAMIKLWVLIAADGNIKVETDLVRIHLWKERKKTYVRKTLGEAEVSFREHIQGDGSSSFNFYTPTPLQGYGIKGLDRRVLQCSHSQFEVILDAYRHSDGHAAGKGTLIYSSKEQEIDWLQALAVQSGYGATKYSREHGFGNSPNHQLSVFPATTQVLTNLRERAAVENVQGEHFWCIRCRNGNFLMRRNGRVHLTGNSHGKLEDLPDHLSFDVGVDCWDFTPVSYAQVRSRMAQKTWRRLLKPRKR